MSIEKLFFNSLMSVASYVDFQDGEDHTEGSTKLKLESNGDWSSEKMRALFLEKFEILSHRKNSYRGFSATVFRVKQSNEVVFANRGTTPTDIGDIHADIDIFLNGISRLQVIDLFNYVSYLKTPLGQSFPVAQITENGVIFNNTGIGAGKGSWFSTPVDITGHSLGGNLSGALGRIFPSLVQDLYVYNSAGTAGILAQDFSLSFPYIKWNPTEFEFFNYFDQFGAVDSYENFQNVFNLFGEDGGEVVTNDVVFNQIGGAKSRIGINTEGATHSSIALSESLSVAWIFNKLDPTFSLADHSALVDAAQASESGSLSKLTNALLLIIQGSKISDLWDGVYNISQLDQTANIKVLATLSHQELLEYYQNSGSKKALIYSAHNGLPFAVEGAYSAYDSIDENQYSSEAIYDLMAKLATELNIYSRDSSPGNELGVGNAKFSLPNDVAIENEESANPLAKRDVVFGSEASDVVSGTAQDNRLYGLGGSDTLNGSDDRDILDGGNDEDKLFGNGGNDLLIGGKGDDELDGGEGNDTLDGGEGNDTYLFTSESGHDVIEKYNSVSLGDSDGVIKYHDKVIDGSGAKKKSEQANIFYDKDEKVTYSKFDNNLLIEFEEDNKIVSSVTIRGFKNGNLGINLPENKEEPEDNTLDKYVATEVFQSYYDDCISEGQNVCLTLDEKIDRMSEYSPEYQAIGNVDFSYTRIAIGGNDGFTFINDTAYKSDVLGGAGDDRLIGGENDDYFRGTGSMANQQVDVDGNDYLAGNGGNDKLFGYEGKDILEGGDGDDFLYGGYSWVAENNPDHETTSIHYASFEEYNADERFKEDNDVLIGGAGRDLIEGHRGSDYLDGGDGDDDLFAGAHNDRIDGGAGDDFILADGTKASKLVLEPSTTLGFKFETLFENAKKHAGDDTVYAGDGNDIVLGGAGNDIIYGGNDDDKLYGDGTYDNDEERIIQESSIDLHGEDIIDGGAGNDLIFGYGNKDVLSGGAGDDKIYGDHDSLDESLHDADIIHGGEGNDEIMGFGGDDRLFGDDGDDVIDAGKGNDYLDGGAGNDELQGQDDDDQLYGKADNDKLFGQKGNDYLDGGSGDDELVGGEGTDVLIGGSGADKLWGNEGDDSLAGGSGDDLLYGGSGNDTLSGGSGYDALRGEEGNDTYIANIGDGFSGISDASGANSIQFGAGVSMGNISVEVIGNGVVLNYGAGDKVFIEDASVGSIHNINFVNGTSISLSSLLRDLIPDNTASGWGGGNTSATINASSNEITYVREDNSLVVRYTGSSEDWIDSEALTNAGYMFTIETVTVNGQPVQQVRFFNWYNANHSRYLNRLHLTDQTVSLSEVTEVSATFSGSDFVDNVNASSASDQISTAGGNDVINAGGGDDVITAGAGNDQVQGGAGNDSYYFNLGDGFDTIFDESGTDRIVFGDGISLNMLQFFETTQGLKVIINNSDYSVNSGFIVIGWFNETNYQIERFEFADGSVLLSAEVDGLVQGNRSPLLNESLTDQSINLGQPFNLTLSPTLFVDPNGDQLSIDVRLSDGSALPAWLTFNAETQTLAGTPGINDIDDLEIVVIARDPSQYFASTQFNINVDEDAGYIGTDADERIEGTDKDDYIRGMGGNDYILGNSGNDRIDGGKGDDRLTGGYGNDTFEFSLSDGIDVIETPYADYAQFTGTDVIKFGKNITQDDVYLYRSPDAYQDLLIMYGNSGDEILVKEYFSRTSQYPIDQIQFNDGSVWTSDDVLEKLQHFIDNSDNFIRHVLPSDFVVDALGGNDFIDGNSGNDILMGNDGDDWLYGKQGDDRLNGGIGNDGLLGEKGNNTYEFSYGHGIDVIWHDNYDSNDIIKIDQTINFNQLEYRRFGDHLVVGTGEENYIIIDEFFGNFIYSDDLNDRIKLEDENGNSILLADVPVSGAYLDKLHWPTIDTRALDGSGLNYGEITDSTNNSFKHRIIGTNDHDIIYGSSDADTISSNDGNDFIEAGAGNDAITIGTGSSIIYPGLGTDVITIAGNSEVKVSDGDGVNYIRKSWRNIDSFKLTADSSFELSDTAFTISDDYNNLSINLSDNTQIILEKFIESDASEFNLNEIILIKINDQLFDKSQFENLVTSRLNFAPIGKDDSNYEVVSGQSITISSSEVLANDIDWNNDSLSFESPPQSDDGFVEYNSESGTITFTPDEGFIGSTHISYWPFDGNISAHESASIFVNVTEPVVETPDGGANDDSSGVSENVNPSDYDYQMTGTDNAEQLYRSNQNDYIEGLGGDDQLFGLGGDDYLNGGEGNDYLDGGAGNDIQIGGDGNDQLGGDAGDDTLIGGSGNDIYVFRPGSGQDIIVNSVGDDGVDWLIFTGDITSDRLSYHRSGNDLIILISDSTDQVTIKDWFLGGEHQVDYIQPAGSGGISANQINEMVTDINSDDSGNDIPVEDDPVDEGAEGNDEEANEISEWVPPNQSDYTNHLVGTDSAEQLYRSHQSDFIEGRAGNDQLFGLGGNDYLAGESGNDYIDGGEGNDIQFGGDGADQLGGDPGNDLLIGGSGNDIYVFRPGAGQDSIRNEVGENGVDWLIFTDDITEDRLSFTRSANNLLISIEGTSDTVTVENWFVSDSHRIDYIQPSGGSGISANAIEARIQANKEIVFKQEPILNNALELLIDDMAVDSLVAQDKSTVPGFAMLDVVAASIIHERSAVSNFTLLSPSHYEEKQDSPLEWITML